MSAGAAGAFMCVCPNKCVSLSRSASASYERFKPRLQHGCAGREIAFHFCIGLFIMSLDMPAVRKKVNQPLLQKAV